MPVLIVNGEFDPAKPRSMEMSQRIKGAEHRTISRSGHACCIEQPGAFAETVGGFLKQKNLWPSP